MAFSKVIFNGTTLMDVTSDTVDAANLLTGYTATKNDGTSITGSYTPSGGGPNTDPTIESGVLFIDYDGNIVEEWATSSVAGKSALPSNPSHTGLTAQGWNWDLSDIKTYISNYPSAMLLVGQQYITASGATEIDISLPSNLLHPYLGIAPNGTVVVDWGDGSATSTLTGTSNTTTKWADHVYTTEGNYTIKLTVSSGDFAFYSTSNNGSGVLQRAASWGYFRSYGASITAIRIGSNAKVSQYAFANCYNTKYITIPTGLNLNGNYIFTNNKALTGVVIPSGTTAIGQYCFAYSYSLLMLSMPNTITSIGTYGIGNVDMLKYLAIPQSTTSISSQAFTTIANTRSVIIPNSITTISSSAFYQLMTLQKLTISNGVTTIQANAFYNCRDLLKIRFERSTPPTISASSAFSGLQTYCVISVPTGSLSAYTSASNYPSSSSYTYIEEA